MGSRSRKSKSKKRKRRTRTNVQTMTPTRKTVHWCDGETEGKIARGSIVPLIILSKTEFNNDPSTIHPMTSWTPGEDETWVITLISEGFRTITMQTAREFLKDHPNLSTLLFYLRNSNEHTENSKAFAMIKQQLENNCLERSDEVHIYPPVHPETKKQQLEYFIHRLRTSTFCEYSGNKFCCDADRTCPAALRKIVDGRWRQFLISRSEKKTHGDITNRSLWDYANDMYVIKNTVGPHGYINPYEFIITPRTSKIGLCY